MIDENGNTDSKPSHHRRVIMLVVTAVFLLVATLLVVSTPRPKVILTVPSGFRGEVLIVEDPNGAVPGDERGVPVIDVPESGVARVTDARVFGRFNIHSELECRERDGVTIPRWNGDNNAGVSFTISDAYFRGQLFTVKIVDGARQMTPGLKASILQEWAKQGVPSDFVAPKWVESK